MPRPEVGFERQRNVGTPRTVGDVTITPESHALVLRWPRGTWVWNRPAAIRVDRSDGTSERVPIVDVTRITQWALLGAAAGLAAISATLALKSLADRTKDRRSTDE